jgi:hypothetical protein
LEFGLCFVQEDEGTQHTHNTHGHCHQRRDATAGEIDGMLRMEMDRWYCCFCFYLPELLGDGWMEKAREKKMVG